MLTLDLLDGVPCLFHRVPRFGWFKRLGFEADLTVASTLSVPSKEVFNNNNLLKAATFRPKKGLEFAELVRAASAFKAVFGRELQELEEIAAANSIREGLLRELTPGRGRRAAVLAFPRLLNIAEGRQVF